ncbi:hypothetical protein STCU_10202 [Strigomonas culicis]|uniref:Uncharacterized protein n=1 Tax=Strigomonas culicis TaxID=28005 RepID=S9TMV1_9TRYP|nr:hypothetical protein STCU_10202 [Strigomonas culicis]|eukprot:EPY18079.1 hypothetical protein STCU_10202 [Strigomonas culicis]
MDVRDNNALLLEQLQLAKQQQHQHSPWQRYNAGVCAYLNTNPNHQRWTEKVNDGARIPTPQQKGLLEQLTEDRASTVLESKNLNVYNNNTNNKNVKIAMRLHSPSSSSSFCTTPTAMQKPKHNTSAASPPLPRRQRYQNSYMLSTENIQDGENDNTHVKYSNNNSSSNNRTDAYARRMASVYQQHRDKNKPNTNGVYTLSSPPLDDHRHDDHSHPNTRGYTSNDLKTFHF